MSLSSLAPSDDENKRYCIKCKQKEPPVETLLELGKNINAYRWNRSTFTCNDCCNLAQREYRGEKYAEYHEQNHLEVVEELTQQWNDPAYRNLKEIGDRVYKVWNKYGRRTPNKGIRRDWICEVIFADLWFIDANGIVEDYLEGLNIPRSAKLAIKSQLVRFVSSRLEHEVLYYQEKARNRWNGIVDAIAKKYQGKDKLVATPKFNDPVTKEFIANWYLLSRERERDIREEIRDAKIERLHAVTEEEKLLIERREVIEKRQKAKQENADREQQDDTNNSSVHDEGGDT